MSSNYQQVAIDTTTAHAARIRQASAPPAKSSEIVNRMNTRGSMSHTPGPWSATHTGGIESKDGGRPIATNACPKGRMSDEGLANARLIAAAPDLLEALREIVEACPHRDERGTVWAPVRGPSVDAAERARAAIAKAEGKS